MSDIDSINMDEVVLDLPIVEEDFLVNEEGIIKINTDEFENIEARTLEDLFLSFSSEGLSRAVLEVIQSLVTDEKSETSIPLYLELEDSYNLVGYLATNINNLVSVSEIIDLQVNSKDIKKPLTSKLLFRVVA